MTDSLDKPYRQANRATYHFLVQNARKNRNNPTPAESALWTRLGSKVLGVRFLRQYIIGDYIVDFFCPSLQLIIEVDGEYHFTEDNTRFDTIRNHYLEGLGYTVLRFTNSQVLGDIDNTICQIRQHIH